jgi:hypothetical protein
MYLRRDEGQFLNVVKTTGARLGRVRHKTAEKKSSPEIPPCQSTANPWLSPAIPSPANFANPSPAARGKTTNCDGSHSERSHAMQSSGIAWLNAMFRIH